MPPLCQWAITCVVQPISIPISPIPPNTVRFCSFHLSSKWLASRFYSVVRMQYLFQICLSSITTNFSCFNFLLHRVNFKLPAFPLCDWLLIDYVHIKSDDLCPINGSIRGSRPRVRAPIQHSIFLFVYLWLHSSFGVFFRTQLIFSAPIKFSPKNRLNP